MKEKGAAKREKGREKGTGKIEGERSQCRREEEESKREICKESREWRTDKERRRRILRRGSTQKGERERW